MELTKEQESQLASILGCKPSEMDSRLLPYRAAAEEEYVRMFLGERVLTRGSDIREYRLYLLIKHVFDVLPTEKQISDLFQTTTTQSRGLLRAVMSKYQYELQMKISHSLRSAIHNAQQIPGNNDIVILTIDSKNVIDALNREISEINGALPAVSRQRDTVCTYEIAKEVHDALIDKFR